MFVQLSQLLSVSWISVLADPTSFSFFPLRACCTSSSHCLMTTFFSVLASLPGVRARPAHSLSDIAQLSSTVVTHTCVLVILTGVCYFKQLLHVTCTNQLFLPFLSFQPKPTMTSRWPRPSQRWLAKRRLKPLCHHRKQ